MADSEKALTSKDILQEKINLMIAELKCWRERHPIEYRYVAEEARAKLEGREPHYIPPVAII